MDVSILFRLVFSHLLTDFIFQSDSNIEQRREKGWSSTWLYVHGTIAGILAYMFTWEWSAFWIIGFVFISHVLIDGIKSTKGNEGVKYFLLDQTAHFVIILIIWFWLTGPQIELSDSMQSFIEIDLWVLAIAYIAVLWPSGILVGKATEHWRQETENTDENGLEKAGLWIGRLERFLLLTFVLLKQYEAIGLLVAAKSIFRFSETRKISEYVLIGTLFSFAIAIFVGLITSVILYGKL